MDELFDIEDYDKWFNCKDGNDGACYKEVKRNDVMKAKHKTTNDSVNSSYSSSCGNSYHYHYCLYLF